jgi:plastocyanin domain-containing protein
MNKTFSIIISLLIIIGAYFFFVANTIKAPTVSSTEVKDGVQYVTIQVKGGYSPRVSLAKADIPTKLIMKTNETRDCSSSLVIKSIGYQKVLPATGETIIDIGTKKKVQDGSGHNSCLILKNHGFLKKL